MSEAIPLTPRQARALDHIARCPSCGAWTYWRTIRHAIEAELDPGYCHHEITHHVKEHAA